jgi:hypothetical protein
MVDMENPAGKKSSVHGCDEKWDFQNHVTKSSKIRQIVI